MKRALAVSSLLSLLAAPSLAQTSEVRDSTIRLDQLVIAALRSSPVVSSADAFVRVSISGERVATGAFIPSATLTAAAVNSNQALPSGSTPTAGSATSYTNNYYAGVASSIDLITGGRRSALVTAARATTRSAAASYNDQKFAITLVAQSAFYAAQRARELVDVAGTTVVNADRALQYATTMLRNGTATRADVLQAEYYQTTARQQLIAARDTLLATRYALGRLAGVTVAITPVGGDSLPDVSLALSDSALLALASSEAPSVRAVEEFETATEAGLRAARTEYFPTVRLSGGYDWANQSAIAGAVRTGFFVGAGTSFPLFNGFVREDDVERAAVARDVARVSAADQQRLVHSELARLLADMRATWDAVGQATEGTRVAAEEVRVMTARYQAGVATFLDLSTAELHESQAGAALASARFAYLIARASLEALAGRPL